MSDKLAVPVEFVLHQVDWAELVWDRNGESPRIIVAGLYALPVVQVTGWEGEWPTILD